MQQSKPIELTTGRIQGILDDGIAVFRGIPYADPPIGELRWKAPQGPAPWHGVRKTEYFGPCAMQSTIPGDVGTLIGLATHETSENCLYLNVWTPGVDSAKRPVLVWIHGGGNTAGSGSQPRINGRHLANRGDVVVVSFNYRLGAFGFLHAPEIGASGNEALLDQIYALRWVRREIAQFGGDPSNITVFGQSAGGFDIVCLMAMQEAKGCFDRAVPMSGSLTEVRSSDEGADQTNALARAAGGFDKLRSLPSEQILQLQSAPGHRWGPVLEDNTLPKQPADSLATAEYIADMPLMIGTCRDESRLFTVFNEQVRRMSKADLEKRVRGWHESHHFDIIRTYHHVLCEEGLSAAPSDIWAAISTDQMFGYPAIRAAEYFVKQDSDVWVYRFDHESPAHGGALGACHSLDIPFVWGTYAIEDMQRFCGTKSYVPRLSDQIMDCTIAFARTGNPNHDGIDDWATYDTSKRQILLQREEPTLQSLARDDIRRLWAGV